MENDSRCSRLILLHVAQQISKAVSDLRSESLKMESASITVINVKAVTRLETQGIVKECLLLDYSMVFKSADVLKSII